MSDEIIREVWDIKDAIGKEANYNLHSLGVFLRKRQQTQNKQVVDLSSKRKIITKKITAVSAEQSYSR